MTKLAIIAVCFIALPFLPATSYASPSSEVAGKLVSLQGKTVKKFDDAPLANAKFFAVYYSASWCGPCREFTPKLVSWYNANKSKYPQFELIFVSSDESEEDMEEYMKADAMPWPALSFRKKASSNDITKYAGNGIPCLVFIDDTGKVLSDSYEGENYLGPNKVLRDMEKLLSASPAVASTSTASSATGPGSFTSGATPASQVGSGKFDIFATKK